MKKIFLLVSSFAVIALLGAGCGSYSTTTTTTNTPPPPANNQQPTTNNQQPGTVKVPAQTSAKADVIVQNFSFNPSSLTVNKGMTVVWTNNDAVGHTITADQGNGPASGVINPGQTYAYTFNTSGTFGYHCSIHTSMQGTVIVN